MRVMFLTILAAALMSGVPVQAGIDVDFGARVRIGDDTDLYFAISSRYFERDRHVVEDWGRRYRNPDDLAVALFISRRSGRSLDFVFSLRSGGANWWDVGAHCDVPVNAWFVPVQHDPGPPYANAYGHWKKHGKRHKHSRRVALTDVDARNLVAVRLLHEYYGVSVEVAMQYRADGDDLRMLTAGEYQRRHGKASAGQGNSGKGKAAAGHGKGKPHKH